MKIQNIFIVFNQSHAFFSGWFGYGDDSQEKVCIIYFISVLSRYLFKIGFNSGFCRNHKKLDFSTIH